MGGAPYEKGKAPGTRLGYAILSSEDEEIENPTETEVSRGASLVEPEKASISQKRKVIVNSGQYKASRGHKNPNSKTSVWARIKEFPGQHLDNISTYSSYFTKFLSNFFNSEQVLSNVLAYFLATF